jgi:hypothetical protein
MRRSRLIPTASRRRADNHVMNSYREASTHVIRGPRTAILKASTPEERATYGRWARIVLACYGVVFVWGCIAVLADRSIANPDSKLTQALSQTEFPNLSRAIAP